MSQSHQNRLKTLVTKLLILLITNILISMLCSAIIFRWLAYTATSIDLTISNLCLLLTFKFNEQYYFILCKPCVWCATRNDQ